MGRAFREARLSEVGGERLSAANTTDGCPLACSAVFARARGLSKMAVARCMSMSTPLASTSGKGFRKADTVNARRVRRAFRPSVEMGACHRDCARQTGADDPTRSLLVAVTLFIRCSASH